MEDDNTLKCRFLFIHCYLSDETDGDEIFLKCDGKKFWPIDKKYGSMKEGRAELDISLDVNRQQTLEIEVWDYDLLTPNDLLGRCKMTIDGRGGPYRTDMTPPKAGDMAKYTLEWEVV